MKTTSKTMTTLARIRCQYEQYDGPAQTENIENSPNDHNVVEFSPEELDEYKPLNPEEADECQLAEFFQEHDFSFLFEDQTVDRSQRKRKRDICHKHMIPSDENDDENRECKRVKLQPQSHTTPQSTTLSEVLLNQ